MQWGESRGLGQPSRGRARVQQGHGEDLGIYFTHDEKPLENFKQN